MSAHDFDKTLKEKAYDIRLEPSPRVWSGIAEELERKRRRRGAAWIFTAAAIVSGLAIFTYDHFYSAGLPAGNNQVAIKTPIVTGNNSSGSAQKNSIPNKPTTIDQNITPNPMLISPSNSSFPTVTSSGLIKQGHRKSGIEKYDKTISDNNGPRNVDEVLVMDSEGNAAFDKMLYPALINGRQMQPSSAIVIAPSVEKGNNELNSRLIVNKKLSSPDKWHISVFAGAGSSSLMSGGLQQYNSFVNEYNYMVNIPAGIAAIQQRPSDVKSGPSFLAGIQVSRRLSRKISAGVGLQYAYNSNRINLGNQIDSAIAIYNDRQQMVFSNTTYKAVGNSGDRFYNQYHFIAVPVELAWNFDRNQRWCLNAGFSLGYLAGVNAVHYNNTAGVYYRNNQVFRKMQTTIISSVQYKITSGNKAPVWIGPYAQYNLTKLDKTNSDKHIFVIGVGAKLQLK